MTTNPTIEDPELTVESEQEEDEASVSYDIASYPSDLTLSGVYEMYQRGDIVIPDYQRSFVWTQRQASLLIESFLLGLPVPQVFLYVDDENKSEVIDGQQRIMSVVYFMNGEFGEETVQGTTQVFRLVGLSDESPFAKKKFDELPPVHQRKLRGAVLRAINIRQLNPSGEATSVYHIFERLNTGGTPLKAQEIRNCVFRGDFNKILRELNQNSDWRAILGKKNADRHQKDVELLLRVFALSYDMDSYEKPMKEFLNRAMSREKSGSSELVRRFRDELPRAAKALHTALGSKAFHVRGPLNSSVLDTVFASVLRHGIELPADFAARYKRMVANKEYSQTTFLSTSDKAVVLRRYELTNQYLFG